MHGSAQFLNESSLTSMEISRTPCEGYPVGAQDGSPMLGLHELTERKGAAKGLTRSVTDAHVLCPRCLICDRSSAKSPVICTFGGF